MEGTERQNEQGEKSILELLWPGVVSGNSKGLRGMDGHTHTLTHSSKRRQIVKQVVGKVKNSSSEGSRQRNKDRVTHKIPNSPLLTSSFH